MESIIGIKAKRTSHWAYGNITKDNHNHYTKNYFLIKCTQHPCAIQQHLVTLRYRILHSPLLASMMMKNSSDVTRLHALLNPTRPPNRSYDGLLSHQEHKQRRRSGPGTTLNALVTSSSPRESWKACIHCVNEIRVAEGVTKAKRAIDA